MTPQYLITFSTMVVAFMLVSLNEEIATIWLRVIICGKKCGLLDCVKRKWPR